MGKSFKRQLAVSLSIVLGTIAVSWAALYFLSSNLSVQADTIVKDKAFIAEENAVLGNLASLKSSGAQAAPYADAIKKLLPTHDELIGFPQWINTLAGTHNVSASFAFQGNNTASTAASPGSDGFSMSASGSAENIISFLNDLEARAPGFLIAIDTFDFVGNGSGYQFSAQGRLFSQ